MIEIEVAGWSDRGRVRPLNEDRVFYQVLSASDTDPIALCMVADGMGGHFGGEVASHWAVETLKLALADLFAPEGSRRAARLRETSGAAAQSLAEGPTRASELAMIHVLREAIRRANHVVRQYVSDEWEEGAMAGSTLTMALVKGTRGFIANVGDSRTYLLREGQLAQMTRDHSAVAELVAAGQITLAESFNHPRAGLITRCVGCADQIEPDIGTLAMRPGDLLMLCSDGVWAMLRDARSMARILHTAPDLGAAARELIAAANAAGGRDNASVALLRLAERPDLSF